MCVYSTRHGDNLTVRVCVFNQDCNSKNCRPILTAVLDIMLRRVASLSTNRAGATGQG